MAQGPQQLLSSEGASCFEASGLNSFPGIPSTRKMLSAEIPQACSYALKELVQTVQCSKTQAVSLAPVPGLVANRFSERKLEGPLSESRKQHPPPGSPGSNILLGEGCLRGPESKGKNSILLPKRRLRGSFLIDSGDTCNQKVLCGT